MMIIVVNSNRFELRSSKNLKFGCRQPANKRALQLLVPLLQISFMFKLSCGILNEDGPNC